MPAGRGLLAAAQTAGALALAVAFLSQGARTMAADIGENGPPAVKITRPANGSRQAWNSLVSYDVVVSYRGKSTRYQEIPASEVLLQTIYAPNLAAMADPSRTDALTPPGLLDIVDSNCLGCHDFKAKAMGPSFAAIAARYPYTPATLGLLSQHIRVGSSGTWGGGSMPSHPELSDGQLHDIVLWILKDAADPNVSYYAGTEGAFRMQASGAPGANAGMILRASYTSPAAASPGQAAHGEDTVIVHGR